MILRVRQKIIIAPAAVVKYMQALPFPSRVIFVYNFLWSQRGGSPLLLRRSGERATKIRIQVDTSHAIRGEHLGSKICMRMVKRTQIVLEICMRPVQHDPLATPPPRLPVFFYSSVSSSWTSSSNVNVTATAQMERFGVVLPHFPYDLAILNDHGAYVRWLLAPLSAISPLPLPSASSLRHPPLIKSGVPFRYTRSYNHPIILVACYWVRITYAEQVVSL